MRPASSGARRLSAAQLDARKVRVEPKGITRKELAAAARDAMKALLLRPSVRQVLAELVGCWGEKTVEGRLLVWPSNDYLCRRTGLSERAVRYGIRGLVEHKLIAPRDSANGKRYAITKDGRITDAYGFDLAPVYARREEWGGIIAAQNDELERHRRLFDAVTIERRGAQEALEALAQQFPSQTQRELADELERLRERLPARRVGADEQTLVELRSALSALRLRAEETFYTAACAGNECRHIETTKGAFHSDELSEPPKEAERGESSSPSFKPPNVQMVLEACPALADYPRPIRNEVDMVEAGRYLRGSLGASEHAWNEVVKDLGPVRAAIVVALTLQLHTDDVLSGRNQIRNPGGYFRALGRLAAEGRMNLMSELMTMRRRRMSPG